MNEAEATKEILKILKESDFDKIVREIFDLFISTHFSIEKCFEIIEKKYEKNN